LFAEIAQRIIASQDEKSIKKVQEIQDTLLEKTEVGKIINKETKEFHAASQSLEALGENLNRATLLELVVKAPNQERIRALTSLIRPAMDYEFFQMLTDRIENTEDEIRKDLVDKRNLMLKLTQEIDQQIQDRIGQARQLIDQLVESTDFEKDLISRLNQIDQYFIQALSIELELADQEKKAERKGKLEEILHTIQEATTPEELKVLDSLLSYKDDEERLINEIKKLEPELSARLNDYLVSLIASYEEKVKGSEGTEKDKFEEALTSINAIYTVLLRESMKMKFEA
jgi:hypothetical protein